MAPVLKVFGAEYSLFGQTQLLMIYVNLPPYTGTWLLLDLCVLQEKLSLFISQELLESVVSVCLYIQSLLAQYILS